MKTGVCSTDFERSPLLSPAALFEKIKSLGFDAVQFSFTSVTGVDYEPSGLIEIPEEIPLKTVLDVYRASEKIALPVGVINATFNMAHPDRLVREEGLRRFAKLAEIASAIGCPILSLCTGTRNTAHLWRPSPDNGAPEAWETMLSTVRRAAQIAEKAGVCLAVETEASNVVSTPEKARRLLDEIGSANLGMILDPANLFLPGEARPENARSSLDRAFECFGSEILLAHGKDIRAGDGIDFCGTGLGMVDFPYLAGKLRASGFRGAMYLHGIYDEADMPRALSFWKKAEGTR